MPLIEIDFHLMEHALANLLMNSIQYSLKGSEITLIGVVKYGKAILVIEDQGPGVPADQLNKIFEKFYRIPGTPTGGTGLGLSIVKGIVELHQGSIEAGNRNEGGARFTIVLPLGNSPDLPKE